MSQIPPKYLTGGVEKTLELLQDHALRQRILFSIFHEADEFESSIYSGGFDNALIAEARFIPQYIGQTIGSISRSERKDPIDVMAELLIASRGTAQGIYLNQNASDILRIMQHPRVFCGSDWSDYRTRMDPQLTTGGHPRGTGTMVRRLELVRDFNLRTPEDNIRNVTYDAAQALGLPGQGLLREGRDANICVMEYERLHAPADYTHPFLRNEGIYAVLVNGVVAVRQGSATGARAGRTLLRGE